jgi:hypothetical protein
MYGRRNGTGSAVVSGGWRHPAGRLLRRFIGETSSPDGSGGQAGARGQHEQIALVLAAGDSPET